MLMCCVYRSAAAQQTAKLEPQGRLEDGSWIVTIADIPYKCLTADQVRAVQKTTLEHEALTSQVGHLSGQINTLKDLVASKDRQIDLLGKELTLERGVRFDTEKQLTQANELLKQASKRRGKLGKFFEHPVSQVVFHIVLPAAIAKLGN